MMRATMQTVDGALATLTRRDSVLEAASDSAPVHLVGWFDHDQLRKLQATPDSGANEPSRGEIDFWFVGGDLAVAQTPTDVYAIDLDRIVLWTDQSLVPRTDMSATDFMNEERALLGLAQRWAAIFGARIE